MKLQGEDDDLDLALSLAILEIQEHQQSSPSQESRPQQIRDGRSQSVSAQPTSVFNSQGRSPVQLVGGGNGLWGKVTAGESEHQKSTHLYKEETSQTVCLSRQPTSLSKQDMVRVDDQLMEEGDINQSEKPKRSKNRRQRRKKDFQQVVGLPCSPSATPPVLLWFRRDLRLCDNPALTSSLEVGAPVIPVFIWSPEEEEGPGISVAMGGACKLTNESVTRHYFFKVQCICVYINMVFLFL